jgi:hypothetical protein
MKIKSWRWDLIEILPNCYLWKVDVETDDGQYIIRESPSHKPHEKAWRNAKVALKRLIKYVEGL